MTPYRVQHINGKPTVLDDKGHEVPGALVLKITYGHEPITDLEGTTVILNGHNEATIVVNRKKLYDVPVVG
jgi:hypothetical protein